jgi:hypothetical protein
MPDPRSIKFVNSITTLFRSVLLPGEPLVFFPAPGRRRTPEPQAATPVQVGRAVGVPRPEPAQGALALLSPKQKLR